MTDFERKLAHRKLWGLERNRKRTIKNMVLLILVIFLLIFFQITVNSMILGIEDRYALLSTGHLTLDESETVYDPRIYSQDTVSQSSALIYGKDDTSLTRIKGVSDDYFNPRRMSAFDMEISDETSDLPNVMLSVTLAEKIGIEAGQNFAMVVVPDQKNVRIRPRLCFVKALYDSGYSELDSNLIFTDIDVMKQLFRDQMEIHDEILLSDASYLDDMVTHLRDQGIECNPWMDYEVSMYRNLRTSGLSLTLIFYVIAVLCGYFVSSISNEMIVDDNRQIAILNLMGMEKKRIMTVYFSSVMIIVISSCIIGTLLALIAVMNLPSILGVLKMMNIEALSWYLMDFEAVYDIPSVAAILFILILMSMFSVRFSLRRLKQIDPILLLNYR